jgi:hypothetical protein
MFERERCADAECRACIHARARNWPMAAVDASGAPLYKPANRRRGLAAARFFNT